MTGWRRRLDRYFEITARGSTLSREVRGAGTTFLTMAYILIVNASVLAQAGVPFEPAVACTALAAAICSLAMGLWANFPIALASGMGLNAVVALVVARQTGSWQTAMGLVVLDGVVVTVLVLGGFREAVLHAIPRDLRLAIGAGIGLFIAYLGAVNGKLIVDVGSTDSPFRLGSWREAETLVAVLGLLVTALLLVRRFRGAILLGIVFSTLLAMAAGVAGAVGELRTPSFAIAFQADVAGAMHWRYLPLLLSLVMVDFFDTVGTVTAVAEQGGLVAADGTIPKLRRILLVDSASASVGGLLGVSSVTSYIESAAGVADGARTGLHSVVVGLLFLVAVWAAPLAAVVPACATAPALILVGFLMATQMGRIDFSRLDTAIPAFLTIVILPFSQSIAHGIGFGFIAFVIIKVVSGRFRDVHPLLAVVAAGFAAYFIWGH